MPYKTEFIPGNVYVNIIGKPGTQFDIKFTLETEQEETKEKADNLLEYSDRLFKTEGIELIDFKGNLENNQLQIIPGNG